MLRTACSLVFVCALATAPPVAAQDQQAPAGQVPVLDTSSVADAAHPPPRPAHPAARPAALVPLYASFATLQALDYHSTRSALADGSVREANPLMRSIVNSPPAFIAVKAAATAGVIVV